MIFPLLEFLAIGALAGPVPAQQNANCAPREAIVERLADKFGEFQQVIGVGESGQLMEIFASPETGTWTVLISTPAGVSCMVASGRGYQQTASKAPSGVPG